MDQLQAKEHKNANSLRPTNLLAASLFEEEEHQYIHPEDFFYSVAGSPYEEEAKIIDLNAEEEQPISQPPRAPQFAPRNFEPMKGNVQEKADPPTFAIQNDGVAAETGQKKAMARCFTLGMDERQYHETLRSVLPMHCQGKALRVQKSVNAVTVPNGFRVVMRSNGRAGTISGNSKIGSRIRLLCENHRRLDCPFEIEYERHCSTFCRLVGIRGTHNHPTGILQNNTKNN